MLIRAVGAAIIHAIWRTDMPELIDAFRDRADERNNTKTYRETTNYVVYELVSKITEMFKLCKEYSCFLIVLRYAYIYSVFSELCFSPMGRYFILKTVHIWFMTVCDYHIWVIGTIPSSCNTTIKYSAGLTSQRFITTSSAILSPSWDANIRWAAQESIPFCGSHNFTGESEMHSFHNI
jgi:hypothetical protein